MTDTELARIQKLADIVNAPFSEAEKKITVLSQEIEQDILSLIGNDEPVRKSEVEQRLVNQLFARMSAAYEKAIEEALSYMLRQRKLMLDHRLRLSILPDTEKPNE